MMYLSGRKLPDKFKPIFGLLYFYRAATANQLLTAMYPNDFPPGYIMSVPSKQRPKRLDHLYSTLRQMVKHGLVQDDKADYVRRKLKVFSLTKEGVELAKEALKIDPDLKDAEGFNHQLGEFSYELQRPPKNRMTHHLLLVDFFLKLNFIKVKHPNITLDYRDNRYASKRYTITIKGEIEDDIKTVFFRPDAELLLQGKRYYAEIDTGSEYLEELKSKFEGYARYFTKLESENRSLPEAIIFVTNEKEHDNHVKRRWKTISSAFLSVMNKWKTRVNLILAPLNHVQRVILEEVNAERGLGDLGSKMKYYLPDPGQLSYMGQKYGVSWGTAYFNVVPQNNGREVLFLYERSTGYETRGICRAYDFIENYSAIQKITKRLANVDVVMPIFYHHTFDYRALETNSFTSKESAKQIMNDCYVLDIESNPKWKYGSGEEIQYPNPLVTT